MNEYRLDNWHSEVSIDFQINLYYCSKITNTNLALFRKEVLKSTDVRSQESALNNFIILQTSKPVLSVSKRRFSSAKSKIHKNYVSNIENFVKNECG